MVLSWNVDPENLSVVFAEQDSILLSNAAAIYRSSRSECHFACRILPFDSKKYRELPFCPDIFLRMPYDIEQFQACKKPEELSLDRFLVYKNFGLVGAVEKKDDHLLINNYCPEIWTDIPAGASRIDRNVCEITDLFGYMNNNELMAKCKFMGYSIPKDDLLTLAAVTLHSSRFGGLHILALSVGLIEDNPISYI